MRVATAVLLTRGSGPELEVFLVRRAETLRFFGGYWACPGGVVDPGDRDGARDGDEVHRRCGLRELFEETGVLPRATRAVLDPADRRDLRNALLGEDPLQDAARHQGAGPRPRPRAAGGRAKRAEARFGELLRRAPGALDAVRPFAELTTPAFAPVRYRTRFVQLDLPAGEAPEILQGELTEGAFAPAREWIRRWRAGELAVVPPVLFLLDMLDGADLGDFLERAARRCRESEEGRLHAICNTPGIVMAPLPTPTLPPATTTNCYIVGEERLYVVDPATYDETWRRRLWALLDERIAAGRELAGVIVTHHHADHVGSVAALEERYGCPVLGHPMTLERLPRRPRDARSLADGDEIDLGRSPDGGEGWKLACYHTPGHDRGHLVFLDSRYGALLAGDLVATLSTIVIDPPEGHLATYLASLRRIRDLPIGMIHPAHGPVAREGRALLATFLEHRAEREASLVEALGRGVTELDELLREVYRDTPPDFHRFARRSLLAGLEKLAEEGRARCSGAAWSLA